MLIENSSRQIDQYHVCYNETKKQNHELETEVSKSHNKKFSPIKNEKFFQQNNNLHMTITNMRSSIEDLKRGNAVSGKSRRSIVTRLFKSSHDV